jgi:hypothetical protein
VFYRHSTDTSPSFLFCIMLRLFLFLLFLLHFIPAIAPYGIHSSFSTSPCTRKHTDFLLLPSPSSRYSYSTLAARLIPRQSSFPSTFPALGLTYISTPYSTHIPILSSPGIYAEQLYFISIRALITFRLSKPGANKDIIYTIRTQLWLSCLYCSALESGKCVVLINRTNSELSNIQ